MAASPQYTGLPAIGTAVCSAANPNRDGTGTLYPLVFDTVGASGRRIDSINIQALVSTSAGMVRLYLTAPASVARLFLEVSVAAITASGTVPAFHQEISLGGKAIPPGYTISASIQVANAMVVQAFGGDF